MRPKLVAKAGRGLLCLILLTLLAPAAALAAKGPVRVVIMPFTANAKDDITFLVKGVRDMLATRLAWQDKVIVIEPDLVAPVLKNVPPPYNDQKARQVGKELNSQVVVHGSITALGKTVSVDARVVKVGDKKPALTSFMQAADLDQVIPQINDFAQRINAEIFKRPEAVAALKKAEEEAKASLEQKKEGEGGKKIAKQGDKLPENVSPLNPLFLRQLTGVESDRYWRSPRLKGNITSLAVADIDQDGKNELLALMERSLRVYRLTGKYFSLLQELKGGPNGTYLFVDAADVDLNGRPEIFVTNMNNMSLQSFVLEWEKGRLHYKLKDQPWYYRVQPRPNGKGQMLLAQKRDVIDAFVGPIYEMTYADGKYVPKTPLKVVKRANVLNSVQADLNDSGNPMTVLVGPSNDLLVYSSSGERLWTGDDIYAGSSKVVKEPPSTDITDPGYEDHWNFVPTRLVLTDLDSDGRPEVVVVKNKDRLGMMLEKMRMFFQGTIFSLAWNGISMQEMWRTPRISGYITDYTIADVGNVGRPALVMAVGQRVFSGFMDKGEGNIIAFTLKPITKKAPELDKGL